MKKIILPAIIFLSLGLFSFRPSAEKDLKGIWKGAYGTAENVTGIIVFFKKGKIAEVYSEKNNGAQKMKGGYTLSSDNELVVSFNPPGSELKITMKGKLNPSKNFVAGDWQNDGADAGCFYFQKQLNEDSEEIVSVTVVTVNN